MRYLAVSESDERLTDLENSRPAAGVVVLSCRAVNDLDLHLFSKPFPKFYAMKPFSQ